MKQSININFIGLDVSKDTINYAIPNPERPEHFLKNSRVNNNLKGFERLEKEIFKFGDKRGITYNLACETTGIYSFPVMDFFSTRGHHCNEIHAFKIAKYKQTVLNRNKTDKIDAKEIANYSRRYADLLAKPYMARTGELLELGLLLRMANQLNKRDIAFANINEAYGFLDDTRVEGLEMNYAKKGLDSLIYTNGEFKKNFKKGLKDFTKEKFSEVYTCLESIPGVGDGTIPHVVYHTNEFTRFKNGRDFGAYAGVVPNFHESGTSVHYSTKIAHRAICNNRLRAVMSQAGNIAMRYNRQCMDLAARLPHLAFKQRLIAVTRKLAIQMYFCGQKRVMYNKAV